MTIFTWENLSKNLNDSETISEFVERKIAEHNDDDVAHLGTGQSLDIHRQNDIIDHKAGSVLFDKTTLSEYVYNSDLINLDVFDLVGEVSVYSYQVARLYCEYGDINVSSLSKDFLYPSPFINLDYDFLLQVFFQCDFGSDNCNLYIGYSFNSNGDDVFIGLKKDGATSKFVVDNGVDSPLTSNVTIDYTKPYIFRVQYISGENKFYFFLNGVQSGVISCSVDISNTDIKSLFLLKALTGFDGYCYLSDFKVSRALIV